MVGRIFNATALPRKISEFCGSYPIYEIEIEENSQENSTESEESGKKTLIHYDIK